jgi:ParB family chromosome partitioning protein
MDVADSTVSEIRTLELGAIHANAQDRKAFDVVALAELADSIRQHGLVQAIVVRECSCSQLTGDHYLIVAGERRYRATCTIYEATTIRATVVDLDDAAASAVQLIENVNRVDLDAFEEASAYQARMDAFGMSAAEVAAWIGKSVKHVEGRLMLLRLNAEMAGLVRAGDLNVKGAQRLAQLDSNRQVLAVQGMVKGDLNYWAFCKLVDRLLAEQRQEVAFDADSFLQLDDYVADARKGAILRARDLAAIVDRLARIVEGGQVDADELAALMGQVDLVRQSKQFGATSVSTSADRLRRRQERTAA